MTSTQQPVSTPLTQDEQIDQLGRYIGMAQQGAAAASKRVVGRAEIAAYGDGNLADVLKREGGKYALASQCIGGGQGIATVLEAVE